MKYRSLAWMILFLMGYGLFCLADAQAQTGQAALHIQLRYSDGTAVVGETVTLQKLPDELAVMPTCLTDSYGECVWYVGRGLYQLLFERPLDKLSSLAVAEGGLRGLGVTVGDADIAYRFVFHRDGRVYFDAAPEAAMPSPIIPTEDMLHTDLPSTVTAVGAESQIVEETVTPQIVDLLTADHASTTKSRWRFILLVGGGVLLGIALHAWSRKQPKAVPPVDAQLANRPTDEEVDDA